MFKNDSPLYQKYNDTYAEMARMSADLRRTKKTYDLIGLFYILFCGANILSGLGSALDLTDESPLYLLVDKVVFKGLLFYYGYFACYRKNSMYAIVAAVVQLANSLINLLILSYAPRGLNVEGDVAVLTLETNYILGVAINVGLIIVVTALSLLTVSANRKYLWLEQQTGFPYFNQRVEEQKFDRTQRGIKDEYTRQYEKYRQTERSGMESAESARPMPEPESKHSSGGSAMEQI